MAAVLCGACNDICSGACEAVGNACSGCGSICGKACNGCCDVFGDCCANMASMCASPFSIFVVVAVVFNLPSVHMGLQEVTSLDCRGSQWLFVDGLFALINIAASIYMAMAVSKADSAPLDLENPSPRRPSTAFGRAGHLLCYDPIMAIYILILIAFFCWLWTGGIWSLNGKAENGCGDETVGGRIFFGLSFGWAFIFCGLGALGIGVCCAYCGVGESENNASSVPNYGAAATSQPHAGLSTPFVNADTASGKTDDKKGTTTQVTPVAAAPVAAASTPAPAAAGNLKPQEEIPTVQATLF